VIEITPAVGTRKQVCAEDVRSVERDGGGALSCILSLVKPLPWCRMFGPSSCGSRLRLLNGMAIRGRSDDSQPRCASLAAPAAHEQASDAQCAAKPHLLDCCDLRISELFSRSPEWTPAWPGALLIVTSGRGTTRQSLHAANWPTPASFRQGCVDHVDINDRRCLGRFTVLQFEEDGSRAPHIIGG